jgi:di/tricarboxylate transporter
MGPIVSLLILYLCASLITQVVSNSATAALMTPIALNLAATQGVSPAPFAIAMIFAVNTAYMTPMTDSNNLIVRQAGQYDMRDYLINNGPVFILQTLVILLMLAPRLGG